MKKLLWILGYLAALPVLCVVATILVAVALEPDFEDVDGERPPRNLAVMGVRDDGAEAGRCRAFYVADLDRHRDSLPPLRFALEPADVEACEAAFAARRAAGRWVWHYEWEAGGYNPRFEIQDSPRGTVYTVRYARGEDATADTRYRVDPATGQPADFEYVGFFGPSLGVAYVGFGLIGGGAAWLVLVIASLAHWFRSRRMSQRG